MTHKKIYITRHSRFYLLILLFMLPLAPSAQESYRDITQTDILNTIRLYADYACNTLIDEEGKSRCDYNIITGKWSSYETPWHTGQLINALLDVYELTKDTKYLKKAIECGKWWTSLEIKDRPPLKGMIKGIHGNHIDNNLIVFATISDGTPGLYHLSQVTQNPEYARIATNAARWMLNNMYDAKSGLCYDNVDFRTGQVIKSATDFNKKLYYLSRPNTEGYLFKDAFLFSKDTLFRTAFLTLCDSLISFQTPEGLWMNFKPNDISKGVFHPRYNLWNAESLLEAYDMTGDLRYLNSAMKTARFYSKYQQPDGAMFYYAKLNGYIDKSTICSSESAFAGLIWIRLINYGMTEFTTNVDSSLSWLMNACFSQSHPDPNLKGAVIETSIQVKHGVTTIINRDLGTIFALRFLVKYYNSKFV
ncbi:MAG: hypothetical protein PHH37_06520 [Paludibacter sp.]|nr:hypothetical protein [Paludibacter sp.]